MYLVAFENILKVIPHLFSKMTQRSHYVTQPRFFTSRARNFVSYFIHGYDTLWAYPSVAQLKKSLLLTFLFHTSCGPVDVA